MFLLEKPPFGFVLVFLLLSWMFLSNSYKLWFKTDTYYREMRDSLERMPIPFRDFFMGRFENRKRWEAEQKIFNLIGVTAVLVANVIVIQAYFS